VSSSSICQLLRYSHEVLWFTTWEFGRYIIGAKDIECARRLLSKTTP
jgi:hypothetical protein